MDTVKIFVDTQKTEGILPRSWRYIGYDECNYTYIPEGKELLNKFWQLEKAPYYIRTHFMFCTGNCHGTYKFGSTNLYRENEKGEMILEFTYVDRILDTLLEAGHKPFFELGFMPKDLFDESYVEKKTSKWDRYNQYKEVGWSCPPKSYEKWYALIEGLCVHLKERYGEEELKTWYFELWNEPDIFYWKGTCAEYCRLFDYTEAALHKILPECRLGGPVTTGPIEGAQSQADLDFFLGHCKEGANFYSNEKGTRLDYISFHSKGGGFPFEIDAKKSMPSVDSVAYQVKLGLDCMKKHGYGNKELVLSEVDPDGWAAGGVYDNPNMIFRNTEYYATYVAAMYDKIARLAELYGTKIQTLAWAFFFPGERCFEGTRTFVTQRINKPIFNLFQLFGMMGKEKLHFESSGARPLPEKEPFENPNEIQFDGLAEENDIGGMASKNEDGSVQVLVFSHSGDRDAEKTRKAEIKLKGVFGKVKIEHYRIDRTHSNAYAKWLEKGSPLYPEGELYEEIKASDALCLMETPEKEAEGELLFTAEMPAHAISLFVLKKAE